MLDLKEEQKYERLRKLAQELHIPIPEAFLTLEVFDKNGKLLQRHHQRSHSWTRNAYNMMFTVLACINANDATYEAGKLSVKETDGTIQKGAYSAGRMREDMESVGKGYRAAANDDNEGIIVGSGTNAESFEDYAMQTLVAHGTGAGQLSYAEGEAPTKSYAALTWTMELIRYLNNNSGGDVSINEVGLVGEIYLSSAGPYDCIHSRDKLGATVPVPDTGQLKVTYTIQLTYPA